MALFKTLVPHLQRQVVLVDREQLRVKTNRRFFHRIAPDHPLFRVSLPTPPVSFEWSKGGSITLPIDGNDQYGCCYYAAVLHALQIATGQNGTPAQFDAMGKMIPRYLQLSQGDNGLDDATIFGEWKGGVIGPNGPFKMKDFALIDVNDAATLRMGSWRFPCLWTCSIPSAWVESAAPGATWDAVNSPIAGGHAMVYDGMFAGDSFQTETWGIQKPAIKVTRRGLLSCDPEVIACFIPEWYHPVTRLSPAGFTWEQDRQLWIQFGGKDVGPAPWPDPTPTPVPVPPVPVPPIPPTPVPPPPVPVGPQFGVKYTTTIHTDGLFGGTHTGTIVINAPKAVGWSFDNFMKMLAAITALMTEDATLSVEQAVLRIVQDAISGQYGPALAELLTAGPLVWMLIQKLIAIVKNYRNQPQAMHAAVTALAAEPLPVV